MNFKDIHIDYFINQRVTENGIEISRICNFLKCTKKEISKMYESKSLDTELLLRWSKLLEYDFFRIYSQHLIFYTPPSKGDSSPEKANTQLPQFRKNIYTKEVIDFIIEQITTGEMSKKEIIEKYNIPKTTLYKWLSKNQ